MSEDEKPGKNNSPAYSDKAGRDSGMSVGGQKQFLCMPQYRWDLQPEDAIDLAGLLGILYRRKWLIVCLGIFFVFLAFTVTFFMPITYRASTALEIGQIPMEVQFKNVAGSIAYEYKYIETPGAAADRIGSIAQGVQDGPENAGAAISPLRKYLEISDSNEGGVVELILEVPKNSGAIEFLTRLNQNLIDDHTRIFNLERQRIKTQMGNMESKIGEYEGRINSYKRRLESLKKEEGVLQAQLESASQQVEKILAIKARASLEPENEPLGQLLFNNEMARIKAYEDQLRTRLISAIPEARENLIMQVQAAESEIQALRNNLEMMRVRLGNIIDTTVLLPPRLSRDPVSPDLQLNVTIGLIAGFLISVCLSFIVEFWQNNKEKIKAGGR